jgi:hypothetical protein
MKEYPWGKGGWRPRRFGKDLPEKPSKDKSELFCLDNVLKKT